MSHVDILLPFGLPAPEFAPDLLRTLNTPTLSTLVAKAKAPVIRSFDPFARALPHESWLAGRLGLCAPHADSSPALAACRMRNLQVEAEGGFWFLLQPVHIHIARDHLVLTDRRRSRLSEEEARALFDTALPLFRQAGKDLRYGSADTWFVRAEDWRALQTATPDSACGHNIDIWMPKGEGERAWRKLQNEVQMEWHEHAVNLAREAQRLPPVNSLWLWGGADAGSHIAESSHIHTDATANAHDLLAAPSDSRLQVLDQLSEAALAEDWAGWLDAMHALEEAWFAPLLQALQAGRVRQIKLVLSHNAKLIEFAVSQASLRKFWIKPSLNRLLP